MIRRPRSGSARHLLSSLRIWRPLPGRSNRTALAVSGAAIALTLHTSALSAQRAEGSDRPERPRWKFTQEVGAIVGASYFEGPRIARITGPMGGSVGLGLERNVRPDLSARILLRGGMTSLDATEAGATWSLGTLRDVSAIGVLSMDAKHWQHAALRIEGGGGFSVVSGLGDALPFSELSALLPTVEVGAALGLAPREGRRQWWLTARIGLLRMEPDLVDAAITGGWGTRYLVGVRTVR